jgi:hypothetical protein
MYLNVIWTGLNLTLMSPQLLEVFRRFSRFCLYLEHLKYIIGFSLSYMIIRIRLDIDIIIYERCKIKK